MARQAADEGRTPVYSNEGEITFVHLEDENEEVLIDKVSSKLGVLHNAIVQIQKMILTVET